MSSPQLLIAQVQLLSVVGRVGGAEGQDKRGGSLALLSSGFEWANYKIPNFSPASLFGDADDSRRADTCGIHNVEGSEGLGKMTVMVLVMALTSVTRIAVKTVVARFAAKGAEAPASLSFPSWEGPVAITQVVGWRMSAHVCRRCIQRFLPHTYAHAQVLARACATQVMAFGDVIFLWISTGCRWWMVGGGVLLCGMLAVMAPSADYSMQYCSLRRAMHMRETEKHAHTLILVLQWFRV